MSELNVGSIEDEIVTEEEPTATVSTGESQTLHWSDLQNDAEIEDRSDDDEEDEAIAPGPDHGNVEEHALGRVQYQVIEKAKAPVHMIPIVTPEPERPTAVAKECLEEDEVVVTDGSLNKGARIEVPEAKDHSDKTGTRKDHFDKIGMRKEVMVAKA